MYGFYPELLRTGERRGTSNSATACAVRGTVSDLDNEALIALISMKEVELAPKATKSDPLLGRTASLLSSIKGSGTP